MRSNTEILAELKGITLASQNIRSLSSKVDDITVLLRKSQLDVLALQETFLDENTDNLFVHIDKYSCHRLDRDRLNCKQSGGGLVMYTHNKYEFEMVEEWSLSTKHLEIMWVKMCLKDTRPSYIANAYRPPDGDLNEALKIVDDQLTEIQSLGLADVVILGDINIDLLTTSNKSRHLKQTMSNNLMTQQISVPTRITNTSRSLIDHIWVSNIDFYCICGAFDMGLSDHHLVYITRKRAKLKQSPSYFMGRSYRSFDEQLLYHDVSQVNWIPLYLLNDVDHATEYLTNVLLEIFDTHAPVKKIKCKSNQPKWVTGDFLSAIDAREHLCNIFTKHPTPINAARRREAIKLVKRMKNQLKRNYITEALADCKGSSKQTWKVIKELWPSKQKQSKINKIDNLTDENDIANALNEHFCKIAHILASSIHDTREPII